jgi:hypothetical protein
MTNAIYHQRTTLKVKNQQSFSARPRNLNLSRDSVSLNSDLGFRLGGDEGPAAAHPPAGGGARDQEGGIIKQKKLYKNNILFLKLKVKSKYKFYIKFLSLCFNVQTYMLCS